MAKIIYDFYDEKDAAAVAELMKNNKFWIGKFDKDLTGEKFIDYQRKKGTIFAIVGKKNDKVVSYVAAYKTGGQKVANKNQAFICALIIDHKYRMSVFSITEMFSMLIKELVNRGYNDLICEVAKDNFASFYMMRKCGFVIIDENPTLYGDYVLHNYLPGVIKLADRIDFADSNLLPEIMQKLDKKNLYRAESLIDGRFIQFDCKAQRKKHTLLVDTFSGDIAGFHMHDAKIRIWPESAELKSYVFDDFSKNVRPLKVSFYRNGEVVTVQDYRTEHFVVSVPDDIDKISFQSDELDDIYIFYIDEMRKLGGYRENKSLSMQDFSIEEKSAFLSCAGDENGEASFKEMWPHITAPYIEGIFIPNYEKNITISKEKDSVIMKETTEDFILERRYKVDGKRMMISSRANILSDKPVQPMFQFALYDLGYRMDIQLEDGMSVERTYDPEEGHNVTEEMIFLDFLEKEYSEKVFKEIDISFGADKRYRISTDKDAKCFCQLNYLGIRYDEEIYKDRKEIDFGTVCIEEI